MSTNELTSSSPLLSRHNMAVSHEGGLVRLTVGNVVIDMEYSVALQTAALLRLHGGQAKRWCGDTSMNFFTAGLLEDAEEIARKEQMRRWS